MFALLLSAALSLPTLPIVEVCEINETPTIRQIILYRWMHLSSGRSHYVSQWWIITREPLIERRGGMWTIQSDGRRFVARTLRRTTTPHDPEILDRKKLPEINRRAYIDD